MDASDAAGVPIIWLCVRTDHRGGSEPGALLAHLDERAYCERPDSLGHQWVRIGPIGLHALLAVLHDRTAEP